jgi:hypothetical protein
VTFVKDSATNVSPLHRKQVDDATNSNCNPSYSSSITRSQTSHHNIHSIMAPRLRLFPLTTLLVLIASLSPLTPAIDGLISRVAKQSPELGGERRDPTGATGVYLPVAAHVQATHFEKIEPRHDHLTVATKSAGDDGLSVKSDSTSLDYMAASKGHSTSTTKTSQSIFVSCCLVLVGIAIGLIPTLFWWHCSKKQRDTYKKDAERYKNERGATVVAEAQRDSYKS